MFLFINFTASESTIEHKVIQMNISNYNGFKCHKNIDIRKIYCL